MSPPVLWTRQAASARRGEFVRHHVPEAQQREPGPVVFEARPRTRRLLVRVLVVWAAAIGIAWAVSSRKEHHGNGAAVHTAGGTDAEMAAGGNSNRRE
jgi:hypothetical protein